MLMCTAFGHPVRVHLGKRQWTFRQNIVRGIMSSSSQQSSDPEGKEAPDKQKVEGQSKQTEQSSSFFHRSNLGAVNLKLKAGSTPVSATVIHPGLPPEAGSPPRLTHILLAASYSRIFAMHMPTDEEGRAFLEYDQMTSGGFTFVTSTQADISPAMYSTAVPKWPLEIKMQGGHIGRTSLSTVSTMTSPADPEQHTLMTQINQVVLVDRVNRRPTPIQDKWRDKYSGQCVRGQPLIITQQQPPQCGPLSVYQTKVAWSDTDAYLHANFTSYIRFALDAIHDAHRLDRLGTHLTADHLSAGVSQVKVVYLGESREGEVLRVEVWKGEGDRCVVCSIEKDGQVICQVTLTFLSP